MSQPGETPKPLEASLTREVVHRHALEFKPSFAFLQKQKEIQSIAINRELEEHKLKLEEGSDLLSLRVQAATIGSEKDVNQQLDDESCCLNDEEKKAYCETVDQCVDEQGTTEDDKEALRRTMTEVIFKPRVFLAHYKHWRKNWDSDPKLQEKYPDFQDYVFERARAFINARRNEIIASRLRKFQKDSMPKTPTADQGKEQLKDIDRKVMSFIRKHEDELLEYNDLDIKDPKRQALSQKFLAESGLQGAKAAEARKLFEDIIGDIEVAFLAQRKLVSSYQDMGGLAQDAIDHNEDIDQEKWNKMLQDDLQKDPYFKEALEQQQAFVYQASADAALATMPLDSPESVAMQAGGLRIMGYDPATDTYTVRYPDSTLETKMKIIPRPGSKTFDDAEFVFYDKYADKAKGNEVHFKRDNLRSGCNQMFLDYLMNDWIRQNSMSPDFNVNDILTDDTMSRMAERLFDRSLNDIVLTKNMRFIFSRFLEVMMKGDNSSTKYGDLGSFEARVKKMDTVMMNPSYAKKLYKEFEKIGSVAFTVSTLLEHIDYKE